MFVSRMAVGHLTFHPFMLMPWVAWAALTPSATRGTTARALLAAVSLDYVVRSSLLRWSGFLVVALTTVVWNLSTGKVVDTSFDPGLIEASWETVRTPSDVPPIAIVSNEVPRSGVALGISTFSCYQPIFGYGLEKFPVTQLFEGDTLAVNLADRLNVKNPACYLYPKDAVRFSGSRTRSISGL